MESPFRAWGDMGKRRPISAILSRIIWNRVCALTTLPLILFNIFLLILGWWSRTLENFYCCMFHVLSKSILSCAVSGHFSWLADGPAFCRGQSAVQNPKFHQRACNMCSSAKITCGRSDFCRGQSAVAQKLYQNPPRNLLFRWFSRRTVRQYVADGPQ